MNRNAKNRRFHTAYRSLALTARRLARAAKAALAVASNMGLLRRFQREEAGSFVTIAGLAMPVFIGFVGLGTEVGLWLNNRQLQQGAADSAAVSAASGLYYDSTTDFRVQAKAVTAAYKLKDGENGVTVTINGANSGTVNNGPTSGIYAGNLLAVEVIVKRTQERLFSALWDSSLVSISARAVALVTNGGDGCVLALSNSASRAIDVSGSAVVKLTKCSMLSNSTASDALYVGGSSKVSALSLKSAGGGVDGGSITTEDGYNKIIENVDPTDDPYANVEMPTPPRSCVDLEKGATPQPGNFYCGLNFNGSGTNVTLTPGTYFIGSDSMKVNAGATVTGTGVTLVVTTSNSGKSYGSVDFEGGTVTLTAPTSGATSGIAIFGDRNAPAKDDYIFNGGSTMMVTGAIYAPSAKIELLGNQYSPSSCLQLIANTVKISGNPDIAVDCQGKGTKAIGPTAKLVE
jgi:Flp pilus assembly protein TadG